MLLLLLLSGDGCFMSVLVCRVCGGKKFLGLYTFRPYCLRCGAFVVLRE